MSFFTILCNYGLQTLQTIYSVSKEGHWIVWRGMLGDRLCYHENELKEWWHNEKVQGVHFRNAQTCTFLLIFPHRKWSSWCHTRFMTVRFDRSCTYDSVRLASTIQIRNTYEATNLTVFLLYMVLVGYGSSTKSFILSYLLKVVWLTGISWNGVVG